MNSTKKLNLSSNNLNLFIVTWIIINCIQSVLLDLSPDEAYYYVYSKNLAWGYLDHPPVVAALIKIGTFFSDSILGVRMIFILMGSFSIKLIYELSEVKNINLFLKLVLSVLCVHLLSFLALPDVPLVFFSLSYLLLMKKYIEKDDFKTSLLIGLNIALIMLSKYHGVLIIAFSFLANYNLFKRKSFWFILISSIFWMSPHLYWLYENNFQTITFHLVERNWKISDYNPFNSLIFLLLQPLIAGPFMGVLLMWSAINLKSENLFDRMLKVILWGIYIFFLLQSLIGKEVLPHWTTPALLPLLILSYKYLEKNYESYKNAIHYLFIISISVFLVGRIILAYDFIPQSLIKHEIVHGAKEWSEEIQSKADNCPVVFMNNYQEASQYIFYTHKSAISIGNVMNRRTYFDFMEPDTTIFGKRVFLLPNWESQEFNSFNTSNGRKYHYVFIDNFVYYPLIKIETPSRTINARGSADLCIPIRIVNDKYNEAELKHNSEYLPKLSYHIFKNGKLEVEEATQEYVIDRQNKGYFNIHIKVPAEAGKYVLKFGIACGWLPSTMNSTVISLNVK